MSEFNNEVVEFVDAQCLKTTAQAALIKFEDRDEPVWIPQSQIDDASEVWRAGDKGILIISEFCATAKGLT